MPAWLNELAPILGLLAVLAVVVVRLPRVDVGHTDAFRGRRFANWFPLGLTYALLYMGRYNMTVLKDVGALSGADYGDINFWGAITYGVSFLINGPLTDRWGGRTTILIAASGALITNAIIGVLEPLTVAVLAYLFLDEPVTVAVALGGALILVGAVLAMLVRTTRTVEPVV